MTAIQRLVLDVLKPHDPGMVSFTQRMADMEGVDGVTAKLVEIDEDVRTIRVAIQGDALDFEAIENRIHDLSGSIHSVDEVSCGDQIIEDPWITDR